MRSLVYIQSTFLRLKKDNSGATASEYAFLVTFIAIIAASGMVFLGPSIADYFAAISNGAIPPASDISGSPLGGS